MFHNLNTCYRVCQLSYKYFLRYENLETEWKQFLQDAGIKEDLQLGWENGAGLASQGKEVVGMMAQTVLCVSLSYMCVKDPTMVFHIQIVSTIFFYILRILRITRTLRRRT